MDFNEWKIKSIKEVCRIRRGSSPRPIQSFLSDKGIPWLKIADVTNINSRYVTQTKEFIIEEGRKYSRDVSIGDLILSNSATPGIPKFMKIDACVHDGWLIVDNFKEVDPIFMYYMFINVRSNLVNLSNGSVFNNLKTDIVKDFNFNFPPIKYQKAIANILSSLDDKIELNNKINKNLEELAQTLYKRWFVDFEFPNEDGEPYKSSGGKMVDSELGLIPKGWEISNLLDIADYLNGLAVKKFAANDDELSLPVLKIKELGIGNVTAESDRCNLSVPEKYMIKKGDLIFSWSGTLLVDFWTGSKSVLNQHLFKVSSTKYPRWFYYFWTKYHLGKFQNIAKSMATTMGHIKREDLSKSQVFIPIKDLLEQGSSIFEPIIDQILKLRIQNNKLMKVRDELLPKLMNGEIEVPIEE